MTIKADGAVELPLLTASRVPVLDANKRLTSSAVTGTVLGYLDATSSVQTQLDAKQATIADGDLTIARTNGLQAAIDGKEDTINLTASRAVVSGSAGQLRTSTTTVDELAYLSGTTSNVQAQLDAKQDASTVTNIGTVTWSSGPQTATIANVTAKRGYFVLLPTLNQTTLSAAQRTIEVTIEIASLADTDMVIVPVSQMSNHSGGAVNISHARPNSDLGTIRIKVRSAANVDYTGNTTDKFFVSYYIL